MKNMKIFWKQKNEEHEDFLETKKLSPFSFVFYAFFRGRIAVAVFVLLLFLLITEHSKKRYRGIVLRRNI